MQPQLEIEIQRVLAAANMDGFLPSAPSYCYSESDDNRVVVAAISEIRPAVRSEGVECINIERGLSILEAIKAGAPLPPIVVNIPADLQPSFRYALYDGYHRLNLSRALGFSHIAVVVEPVFDFNSI